MKDVLINAEYSIKQINSLELSNKLKSYLSFKNIDFKLFNRNLYGYRNEEKEMNIPVEAYEYQNFVVLETENGDYILLDGFRRLLWNTTVAYNINVRVYKRKDLSSTQILRLLVSLNHTKFFAGLGEFYDRGFALALKTIFNIDISKFYKSFDGYLTGDKAKYDYSNSKSTGDEAHNKVINKIISDNFLADMEFLEKCSSSEMIKSDLVFGTFIYKLREENPNLSFNFDDFISKIQVTPILIKQITSFLKSVDARGHDVGNKMFEMFTNILLNKEGEKSFIEKESEAKDLITKLKKDKKWYCYTKSKKIASYDFWQNPTKDNKGINTLVSEYKEQHGFFPKVKVVVLPSERPLLEYGEYDDFEIIGFKNGSHLMSTWSILQVKRGDVMVGKNYGNSNRTDLSYIEDGSFGYTRLSNNVYLFIENIFN